MPEDHQKYSSWDAARFISWAQSIGKNTEIVVRGILSARAVEQQGYRACMGLLRLASKFSVGRLESACGRALHYSPSPSFKSVQSILIILGATGAGKTYLGCAFGVSACRNFHTVKYIRLPEILEKFSIARGHGNFPKVIQQYKRVELLILDEWLLTPLANKEASDLLELVESRHKRASTIFCSQFSPSGWHEKIVESTVAEAVLDRIVYDSHTILIDGIDSMRKKKEFHRQNNPVRKSVTV